MRFAALFWAGMTVWAAPGSIPADARADAQFDGTVARARAAFQGGKYAQADGLYAAAIAQREAAGTEDTKLARSLYELGEVRKIEERCQEAAGLIERGLGILEAAVPAADAHELGAAWQALGAARACEGSFSQAQHAYLRAIELEEHAWSPSPVALFEMQSDLGAACESQGKYMRAEEAYQAARAVENSPGIRPLSRAFLAANYGGLLRLQGRDREAEEMLRNGMAVLKAAGGDAVTSIFLLNNLAMVEADRKDYKSAGASLASAVDLMRKGAGLATGDCAQLLRNQAFCLRKLGEKSEARELESQASQIGSALSADAAPGFLVDITQLARRR